MEKERDILKLITMATASAVIVIALLGLLGYLPKLRFLGSVRDDYIPMAPSTSISFIILGTALISLIKFPLSRKKMIPLVVLTSIVPLFGILEVAGYLLNLDLNFEDSLFPAAGTLNEIPIARMSPITGAGFYLCGMAILILFLKKHNPIIAKKIRNIKGILSILAFLISFVFSLAYFFGTPFLYGAGSTIPMALTTALGFLLLSISILTAGNKENFPLKLFAGNSTSSYLIRFILPFSISSVIISCLLLTYLETITKANPALISSALTIGIALLSGSLAMFLARHMGAKIDQSKAELIQAEAEILNLAKFPDEDPNPVLRIAPDGILIYANKSSSKILKTWKIKEQEKLPEKWIKLIKDAYESGKVRTFEDEFHGTTYSFSLAPIHGNSYINVYGMDISERIIAEKTLHEHERRFRAIFEQAAVGVAQIESKTGKFIYINKRYSEIIGYTIEEMENLSFQKITYPDDLQQDLDNLHSLLNGEIREFSMEKRFYHKNESIVWVNLSVAPMWDIGEEPTFHVAVVQDITARKEAELELVKHRKNLEVMIEERTADLAKLTQEQQTIFDSVPATIWYKDTENNILKVNKTAADLMEMKIEDIEGHSISELFPEQSEKYYQDDLEVIQSGKPKIGIIDELTTRSGNKIYMLTDKVPVKDENGKITGLIAFAIDITKKKKAEDALKEQYAEVNNLNKAMINLLEDHQEARHQLLQNQHQLESINRELESFSYAVSHDLRAPLRGLDGFSQILLEDYADKLDVEGKDYLRRIRKASTRMGILIDNLLRLSRITRAELKPEEINLSQIVNELAAELTAAEPKRKVKFIIQPDVNAVGDKQLVRIALENMLKNSWKFTGRKKSPKIEFGTKKIENSQETVYYIQDNGAGFDMEYADKLFAPFQRLHSSAEFEGTGIGLATVNRIISRHQGKIWAESTINKGAVFYFTLS